MTATAETVAASADGAAWTELAESAPAITAVVETMPRFGKIAAQFFQGAGDAFAGGVLAGAEGGADFGEVFVLEEAQQERLAVFLAECASASSSNGDIRSQSGSGAVDWISDCMWASRSRSRRFTAARISAMATNRVVLNSQPDRLVWFVMRPAFWARMMKTAWVISSRHPRVADLAQGRGIDKVHPPGNQRFKGGLGIARGVFPEERHVVHRLHSPIDAGFRGNRTGNFQLSISHRPTAPAARPG